MLPAIFILLHVDHLAMAAAVFFTCLTKTCRHSMAEGLSTLE